MHNHIAISNNRRRLLLLGGLLASGFCTVRPAFAAGTDRKAEIQMNEAMQMQGNKHDHEHHHHDASPDGIMRSEANYIVPSVMQVRQDGTKVNFAHELDNGRPVLLDFIYTSCTTICPLTSQIFYELQEKLGKERNLLNMVSVSIDPEYDTPACLREYARQFHAAPQWQHYTGTVEASIAIQKAFDVYRGDKMNHSPVTFLRAAPGYPWVRLDGFASPQELMAEFHNLRSTG